MDEYIEREALMHNLKQFAPEQLTPLIESLIRKQPAIERDCVTDLIKLVDDLIACQQEDIEKLKIENQSLRAAANSYKIHYNEARTEAIKELIERLTKEYAHFTLDSTTSIDVFFCSVKRIAKEMVGEENGKS